MSAGFYRRLGRGYLWLGDWCAWWANWWRDHGYACMAEARRLESRGDDQVYKYGDKLKVVKRPRCIP